MASFLYADLIAPMSASRGTQDFIRVFILTLHNTRDKFLSMNAVSKK
jgi:hypothetical protein